MTPSDVTTRVTAAACVLGVVLAVPAGWLGGPTGALGVLAGGALAMANFRWLATRAIAVVSGAGGAGTAWPAGTALRPSALAAAGATLRALGPAHPPAPLAGRG